MGVRTERFSIFLCAALIVLAAIQGMVVVSKVFDHAAREGVEDTDLPNE